MAYGDPLQRFKEQTRTATRTRLPDPNWLPLLVTPPYPTYAGNAATIANACATILSAFFGRDDIGFEAHWEDAAGGSGWTRSYPGFSALAQEQADSRIYGGIHFRFDSAAGETVGRSVATYIFQNFLVPQR